MLWRAQNGVETRESSKLRQTISETQGDDRADVRGRVRRGKLRRLLPKCHTSRAKAGGVLLHPLPLFNNSIGALDLNPTKRA